MARFSSPTIPLMNIPKGVKNSAAAPSRVGHQSFKNLPITSILRLLLGSLNHLKILSNPKPSKVKVMNFRILSKIAWNGAIIFLAVLFKLLRTGESLDSNFLSLSFLLSFSFFVLSSFSFSFSCLKSALTAKINSSNFLSI